MQERAELDSKVKKCTLEALLRKFVKFVRESPYVKDGMRLGVDAVRKSDVNGYLAWGDSSGDGKR